MSDSETYFENGREYYSKTGSPVWPSRGREHPSLKPGCDQHLRPLAENPYVQLLLARLDELEKSTRPSSGEATAVGKDLAAFQAIQFAGQLVRAVAGWAIDHQRGLALNELRFVPLGTSQIRSTPEFQESRAAVDQHEHERAGGESHKLSPVEARRFSLNLLQALSSRLGLPYELEEALEALDYGEVLPILQKAKTTRRTGLTEYRAKLTAVAYIEYQYVKGVRKKVSTEIVADRFGTTVDSVKDWPVEVRAALGALTVSRVISFARNAGAAYKHPNHADIRGNFEFRFGEPAMMEAAAVYKARGKKA